MKRFLNQKWRKLTQHSKWKYKQKKVHQLIHQVEEKEKEGEGEEKTNQEGLDLDLDPDPDQWTVTVKMRSYINNWEQDKDQDQGLNQLKKESNQQNKKNYLHKKNLQPKNRKKQ